MDRNDDLHRLLQRTDLKDAVIEERDLAGYLYSSSRIINCEIKEGDLLISVTNVTTYPYDGGDPALEPDRVLKATVRWCLVAQTDANTYKIIVQALGSITIHLPGSGYSLSS